MILYQILYALSTFLLFIEKRYFQIFKLLLFSLIIILSTIRYQTGTDWDSYYYYYENINDDYYLKLDLAYVLINYIGKIVFNSYLFVQFFLVSCSLLLIDNVLTKIATNYRISLIYFFCFSIFCLYPTRQYVALAFLLYAFSDYLLFKKLNIKSFLFLTIGCLFHWSAIFPAFILIFINADKLYKKALLVIIVGSAFFLTLPQINLFYLTDYKDLDGVKNISFSLGVIFRLILSSYILVHWSYFKKSQAYESVIILTVTFFNILFIGKPDVFGRILLYGYFFEIMLISSIYKHLTKKYLINKVILIIVLLMVFFLRLYANISNYYDSYVPYKIFIN